MKNNRFILFISLISIVFFISVGFNFSPFLRGPGEWPPEWRWPYLFVNTLDKVWLPLIMALLILTSGYFLEKRKTTSWIKLILLVILSYLFQLSVLYFSRSGISVLIHRIINPDLNGYFTEAIKIKNLGEFLASYQKNVLTFSMHAAGHPPGGIIFFWFLERIVNAVPFLKTLAVNLTPRHFDVQIIWSNLALNQRSTAVFSAFFIPFLASLNLIPLFLLAKKLYNLKTALRSVLLATFIPALTLFTPLPDVFFPLFFLWSFYFFVCGLHKNQGFLMFLAGIVYSLGLFFSLSLLPLIFIYFHFVFSSFRQKSGSSAKIFLSFLIGLSIFYLVLLLFKYNVFSISYTLMTGLPKNRSYLSWIFYNLYDFFIFAGLPLIITYILMFFKKTKQILFVSFSSMLVLLNFSGAVRGEVGRIWLPLMFPLILISSDFLTNELKLSTKSFLVILFLQAVQIIVLQEFWVTLW